MKRYKLIIAYDGTDYHGWQAQPGMKTVAGTLQDSFLSVFGNRTTVLGASRTDAGVHALGQVASCSVQIKIPTDNLMRAWNSRLPASIVIRSLESVEDTYSPFLNVAYKIYQYRLFLKRPSPFEARYGWYVCRPIDTDHLQQALQVFVGTHDFRSFSTGDERGDDTIRTIDTIQVLTDELGVLIVVQGQRFLHHMVRRIVGAACDVASRPSYSVRQLQEALLAKNPHQPFTNAPAQGLLLHGITYKNGALFVTH